MNNINKSIKLSDEMLKIINEYSVKTGLGFSPLARISFCLLINEFKLIEESLTDIDKSLSDMCHVYEKRYSNYAMFPLRKVINLAPKEDKTEILLAIEKVKQKRGEKKEFNSLNELNIKDDENE